MPHDCDWKLVHMSHYVIVEWCRLCGALKINDSIERPVSAFRIRRWPLFPVS